MDDELRVSLGWCSNSHGEMLRGAAWLVAWGYRPVPQSLHTWPYSLYFLVSRQHIQEEHDEHRLQSPKSFDG